MNSFDVVSEVDLAEVKNAVNQAVKEVGQRYDLKGSGSAIDFDEKAATLVLASADEFRLKAVDELLKEKLVRRGVPLKAVSHGAIEPASGGSVRQTLTLQRGISTDKAREIVKFIKDAKLKVQAAIQGDQVRVSGKNRDDLQQVIAGLKEQDLGIDMQFVNYRG
jgi:uncharacterized protein YajQ (UPF0234 family)